jgi:hypothetical protein
MQHKYIKNFQHLINIINKVIASELPNDITVEWVEQEIGNDEFFYKYVYQQPYCDQFAWLITNERPNLIRKYCLIKEHKNYIDTGLFCGKNYNKFQIKISDELKDK